MPTHMHAYITAYIMPVSKTPPRQDGDLVVLALYKLAERGQADTNLVLELEPSYSHSRHAVEALELSLIHISEPTRPY